MSGGKDPTGFIGQLVSNGQPVGIKVDGYIASSKTGGGLILVDSSGAQWLFTVGTDGRLAVQGVTFQ